MVKASNITKKYCDCIAVNDVSFDIAIGEIVGFLGPNGAGKSSIMNILTGCTSCTSGKVLIDNCDIVEEPKKAKSKMGYMPENPALYADMRVSEYLSFVYDLKKVKTNNKNEHILKILFALNVANIKNTIIKHLSKGYKQRVCFAQALIGKPNLLILDEPTAGLDPAQIIDFRNVIKNLGKDHTVILSSHILPEISLICDRVIIIDNGKITADCKLRDIESTLEELFMQNTNIDNSVARTKGDLNFENSAELCCSDRLAKLFMVPRCECSC